MSGAAQGTDRVRHGKRTHTDTLQPTGTHKYTRTHPLTHGQQQTQRTKQAGATKNHTASDGFTQRNLAPCRTKDSVVQTHATAHKNDANGYITARVDDAPKSAGVGINTYQTHLFGKFRGLMGYVRTKSIPESLLCARQPWRTCCAVFQPVVAAPHVPTRCTTRHDTGLLVFLGRTTAKLPLARCVTSVSTAAHCLEVPFWGTVQHVDFFVCFVCFVCFHFLFVMFAFFCFVLLSGLPTTRTARLYLSWLFLFFLFLFCLCLVTAGQKS